MKPVTALNMLFPRDDDRVQERRLVLNQKLNHLMNDRVYYQMIIIQHQCQLAARSHDVIDDRAHQRLKGWKLRQA